MTKIKLILFRVYLALSEHRDMIYYISIAARLIGFFWRNRHIAEIAEFLEALYRNIR